MTPHERTRWRDEEISLRHRDWWGRDCPMVDIDFLAVEYNHGLPVAVVEYKHYNRKALELEHANYRALTELADRAQIPFLVATYWPECWAFSVTPVNELARSIYRKPGKMLTEREFVQSLYYMRDIEAHKYIGVLEQLHDELPGVPVGSEE